MGSSRPAGAAVTNGADVRRGPAEPALSPYRVLIYSHDSFGLGHLRRCRAIAHALVEQHRKLNVLILSGSPIIGRFSFRARVDFVRVPGVIKLRNGEYTSLNLDVNLEHAIGVVRSGLDVVSALGQSDRARELSIGTLVTEEAPILHLGALTRTADR